MNLLHAIALAFACWTGLTPPQTTFTTLDGGTRSRIEAPRNAVVRTSAEWAALWKEHGAAAARPKVDLKRSIVIAVFLGMRPTAGYSVEITRVEKRDAELVVTYRERRPAPGEMNAQVLTAPFHIVRTTSHGGPVRFQRAP